MTDDLDKLVAATERYVDTHREDFDRYAADARCFVCGLIDFVDQYRYLYSELSHDWHVCLRLRTDHDCLRTLRVQQAHSERDIARHDLAKAERAAALARANMKIAEQIIEKHRQEDEIRISRRSLGRKLAAVEAYPRHRRPVRYAELPDDVEHVDVMDYVAAKVVLRITREWSDRPTVDQVAAGVAILCCTTDAVARQVLAHALDRDDAVLSLDDDGRVILAGDAVADLESDAMLWRLADDEACITTDILFPKAER